MRAHKLAKLTGRALDKLHDCRLVSVGSMLLWAAARCLHCRLLIFVLLCV